MDEDYLRDELRKLGDGVVGRPWQVRVADCWTLSGRARNILVNEGIETLGELARRTRAALLRVPNCGKVTVREFEEALWDRGLELGMTDNLNLPDLIEHLYYFYSERAFRVKDDPYLGLDWKQKDEIRMLWCDLLAFVAPTRRALAKMRKEHGDGE